MEIVEFEQVHGKHTIYVKPAPIPGMFKTTK